jgi:hypothetical protein
MLSVRCNMVTKLEKKKRKGEQEKGHFLAFSINVLTAGGATGVGCP